MKKILILTLVLIVVLSTSISSYAAPIDITQGAWYEDSVYFCLYNSLLTAKSYDLYFNPGVASTRGYAIYGLTHALGLALSNNVNTGFTDVADGSIYAGSVKWAVDNGVTAGVGGNLFGLNNEITREQFCLFVYNACQTLGITLPNYETYVVFPDSGDIHSWASEAVQQVYEAGLIAGMDTGYLLPRATITHAQISLMLFKLYALAHYNDNTINVFVRSKSGVPLSNSSVYLYYYNSNTNQDKFPSGPYMTDSTGMVSIPSSTAKKYAINVFRGDYLQGVSKDFIERTIYPETVVLRPYYTTYRPPFKDFNIHDYWTSTSAYLNACQNYGYRYGVGNQYEFHQGIDIGNYKSDPEDPIDGDNVFSISSGVVFRSDYADVVGNIVQIQSGDEEHGYTYITYQHLKQRKVFKSSNPNYPNYGTYTSPEYDPDTDDIIGTVGSSGGDYASHLHLSFSRDASISLSNRDYFDPIACMGYWSTEYTLEPAESFE